MLRAVGVDADGVDGAEDADAAGQVLEALDGALGVEVDRLGAELAGQLLLGYVGPLVPYSFTGADASPRTGAWA